ncbi:V-set and immunoglobulin domain-containing protein 4 isoform X3 [Grammomys surdaster]|uniref:V-set and immunoglobulin domain-containing protein 4 isoform X3 n=1 Tax=Grammomys surdaster TaxID=491861 RepID=UPI00109FF8E4|nr:V-set and immunoglobulin domain-containing protein 4 isoform X3 [Grammomys surdaster]
MEGLPEVASHRIEILSGLLFLGHLIVLTYGHPILKAPESVTGTWKKDVTIPCIYEPLGGYRQVLVKWLVQRGSDPVTIFLHDSTGDHIQQAKYRGRLKMSQKVLGDVSLQLNTLQMDDKNRYTCEVTWQTPDGNQVTRDEIIELRVQKYPYYPPIINTEALTTMQSSLEATTIMNSTSYSTINVTGKHEETISSPDVSDWSLPPWKQVEFCDPGWNWPPVRKEPDNLCHNLHHLLLLHSSCHHSLYHVPPQEIPTRVCL